MLSEYQTNLSEQESPKGFMFFFFYLFFFIYLTTKESNDSHEWLYIQ
jgi:hypothetical protein